MKLSRASLVIFGLLCVSVQTFAQSKEVNMGRCLEYINGSFTETTKSGSPATPFTSPFEISAAGIGASSQSSTVSVVSSDTNQFQIRIGAIGSGDSSGDYGQFSQRVWLDRAKDGRIIGVNMMRDQSEMMGVVRKLKSPSEAGHFAIGAVTVKTQMQLSYNQNNECVQVQLANEMIVFGDDKQTRNVVVKESMY